MPIVKLSHWIQVRGNSDSTPQKPRPLTSRSSSFGSSSMSSDRALSSLDERLRRVSSVCSHQRSSPSLAKDAPAPLLASTLIFQTESGTSSKPRLLKLRLPLFRAWRSSTSETDPLGPLDVLKKSGFGLSLGEAGNFFLEVIACVYMPEATPLISAIN